MSLLLPVPTNLLLPQGSQTFLVEQDLYGICERIGREVEGGDRLTVVMHSLPSGETYFTIMEKCADGVERVAIPRIDELDGRVIERLQYLLRVPLSARLADAERVEAANAADAKEQELDDLYENFGRPMLTQLEHDGFTQRPTSYPKLGVASNGRRAR